MQIQWKFSRRKQPMTLKHHLCRPSRWSLCFCCSALWVPVEHTVGWTFRHHMTFQSCPACHVFDGLLWMLILICIFCCWCSYRDAVVWILASFSVSMRISHWKSACKSDVYGKWDSWIDLGYSTHTEAMKVNDEWVFWNVVCHVGVGNRLCWESRRGSCEQRWTKHPFKM